MSGEFAFDWSTMDQKMGGAGSGSQIDGFDANDHIHNQTFTLGDMPRQTYQPQATAEHDQMPPHDDLLTHQRPQSSEDEVKAASGLYNMSMHAQDDLRGAAAAAWTNLGNTTSVNSHVQANVHSPMSSSGRRSADSFRGQPPTSFTPTQFPGNQAQQQFLMQQYGWGQQQPHRFQSAPRPRHGSLQLDTPVHHPQYFSDHAHVPLLNSAYTYEQTNVRPPIVRFGSDSNFSTHGYQAPDVHATLEMEKGANLNNVPLAQQAAANGRAIPQAFSSATQSRSYRPYTALQGQSSYFHPHTSMAPSPTTFGGLPIMSSGSAARVHGHPYNAMAARTAKYEDDEDEGDDDQEASEEEVVEYEEAQPRKRYQIQMEADDASEYSAAYPPKGRVTKRALKAPKTPVADASEDEYDEDRGYSAKRRKMSSTVRSPISRSASPSSMTSPPNKASSSSKKKGRAAQPRQNLTEDEKRRNHIISEKSRRDLIKLQYDSLDSLVPGLKGGKSGLSRSDVLSEIVTYVESVIDGNKAMEELLEERAMPARPRSAAGPG